jgi:glycogen synthase
MPIMVEKASVTGQHSDGTRVPVAVFVSPRFHPCCGGYENYIAALARSVSATGATVSVFTTNAVDLEAFWLRDRRLLPAGPDSVDGLHIQRFSICYRKWRRRAGRLLSLLPSWKLRARYARPSFRTIGLEAALSSTRADVIHVGPLPYNQLMYSGIRAAREQGARVITTPCTHVGEDANDEVAKHYIRPFQIRMLNACDAVLALTEFERTRLIQAGVGPEKVHHTGAGIDPAAVNRGDGAASRSKWGLSTDPVVLGLGMKAFDKGTVTLVDAMKLLWRDGSAARLVLAGPSLTAFDEYLQSQGPLDRLHNISVVSESDKADLLAACKMLVQASRVESFGLVYLEAWANAKPVIAADIGVAREMIEHGKDGLITPFGDPGALADAIRVLLSRGDRSALMGDAGLAKLQSRYTWDKAAERAMTLFFKTPMIAGQRHG